MLEPARCRWMTDATIPRCDAARISAGIDALTVTERFALKLRVIGGMRTPEIAAAMGWTTAETQAAHNRVRRLVGPP